MVMSKIVSVLVTQLLVSSAFAGLLELGTVRKTEGPYSLVKSVDAQGRHGKYTVKEQASANVEINLDAWKKIAVGQIFIERPKSFGGDIKKLINLLFKSKSLAARAQLDIAVTAQQIAEKLEFAKSELPDLNPTKEMDQLIAGLNPLGATPIKNVALFIEKSSYTLYIEANDTVIEVQSSEALFTTLQKLWKKHRDDLPKDLVRLVYL